MLQFRRSPVGGLDIQAKLTSEKYSGNFIKHVSAKDLTLRYIQEHGFSGPLVVIDKTGLALRVPSPVISASDISKYAGQNCAADILGADPQTTTIGDWSARCSLAAIEGPDSLQALPPAVRIEFSNTVMSRHVEAPRVVRQLDWVDRAWPKHLKQQVHSSPEVSTYPKVQKYCLIAMRSCFVGFTTGISGSASWFHVLRGQITFWLLPPLEKNLELLEKWIISGRQDSFFLGDCVEECQRFTLTHGKTLFLPSGWIYAMYLGDDMLAFHGCFLHSLAVSMQHRVWDLECKAQVMAPKYPFFEQIHWYVLERYVHLLTGTTYLSVNIDNEENSKAKGPTTSSRGAGMLGDCRMAEVERKGLGDLLRWLQSARHNSGSNVVPALLKNPKGLLLAAQGLLSKLDKEAARVTPTAAAGPRSVNGHAEKRLFMLRWPEDEEDEETLNYFKNQGPLGNGSASQALPSKQKDVVGCQQATVAGGSPLRVLADAASRSQRLGSSKVGAESEQLVAGNGCSAPANPTSANAKPGSFYFGLRKNGCGKCVACVSDNCGDCTYCKDMPKFGGTGKMKQACAKRRCIVLTQGRSETGVKGVEQQGSSASLPASLKRAEQQGTSGTLPASIKEAEQQGSSGTLPASAGAKKALKESTTDSSSINGSSFGTGVPQKQIRKLVFSDDDDDSSSGLNSSGELHNGAKKRPGRQASSKGHHSLCQCCSTNGGSSGGGTDMRIKATSPGADRKSIVLTNCGECLACKDMKQYGGPGKMKKACLKRRSAPVNAQCSVASPASLPGAVVASISSKTATSVTASAESLKPKSEPSLNVVAKNMAGTASTPGMGNRPKTDTSDMAVADTSAKVAPSGSASARGTNMQSKPTESDRCMKCGGCSEQGYCSQCVTEKQASRTTSAGKKKSCIPNGVEKIPFLEDSGVATSSASSSSSSTQDIPSSTAAKTAVLGHTSLSSQDAAGRLRNDDGESAPKQRKLSSAASGSTKGRPCRTGKGQACRQRCCVSPSSVNKRKTALERCHTCDGCKRTNCGRCIYCKDMRKFGGPGRMRKACIHRRCVLHVTTASEQARSSSSSSSSQSTDDHSSTSSDSASEDEEQQKSSDEASEDATTAASKPNSLDGAAITTRARKIGLLSKKLRTNKALWAKLQMPWRMLKAHDRCFKCEGCRRLNCGKCLRCLDMKQFGGPGRLKKACLNRQCTGLGRETSTVVPSSAGDSAAVATEDPHGAAVKSGQQKPEARLRNKSELDGRKAPAEPVHSDDQDDRCGAAVQPVRAGQPPTLAKLSSQQPLPVASKAASETAAAAAAPAASRQLAPQQPAGNPSASATTTTTTSDGDRRKRQWTKTHPPTKKSRAPVVTTGSKQQRNRSTAAAAISTAAAAVSAAEVAAMPVAQGTQQRMQRSSTEKVASGGERAAVDGLLDLAAVTALANQKHGHGAIGRAQSNNAAAIAAAAAPLSSRFSGGPKANQPKDTGIFIPSSEEAEYRSQMEKLKVAEVSTSSTSTVAAVTTSSSTIAAAPISAEQLQSGSLACTATPTKQLKRELQVEQQHVLPPAMKPAAAAAVTDGRDRVPPPPMSPQRPSAQQVADGTPKLGELSPTGSTASSSSSPAKRQRLDRAGKGVPCRRQCSCCADVPRTPSSATATAYPDSTRTSSAHQPETSKKPGEQQLLGGVSSAALLGNCGQCAACKDMKRFGGPGKLKKACMSRRLGSSASASASAMATNTTRADKAGDAAGVLVDTGNKQLASDISMSTARRVGSSGAVGRTTAPAAAAAAAAATLDAQPKAAHGKTGGSDRPGAKASASAKRKILGK